MCHEWLDDSGHSLLNGVISRQISYDVVPYARFLIPVKFFRKYPFNVTTMLPATAKYNLDRRITLLIRASTGIKWVRMARRIS